MKQKNGMPLAQAAAEDIIEMIRTNHMKPGDRLENEYELAKKLNVGRSTVREAVKSLETRNILTIKRGAGTVISQNEGVAVDPLGISLMGKDEEMALELLDVRMILEPESAALAAIHADKNEIAEISRQNRKVIGMITGIESSGRGCKISSADCRSDEKPDHSEACTDHSAVGRTDSGDDKQASDGDNSKFS